MRKGVRVHMIQIKYLLDVGPRPIHKQGMSRGKVFFVQKVYTEKLRIKKCLFLLFIFFQGCQDVLMQTGLGYWHPFFTLINESHLENLYYCTIYMCEKNIKRIWKS